MTWVELMCAKDVSTNVHQIKCPSRINVHVLVRLIRLLDNSSTTLTLLSVDLQQFVPKLWRQHNSVTWKILCQWP